MTKNDQAHRVVVIGGGVAGLEIASALGRRYGTAGSRRPGRIVTTLVDREWAHVWKPMLHTVAAGTTDLAQQQTDFLAQAREAGFRFEPGELCGLDRARRTVLLAPLHAPDGRLLVPGRHVAYDTLVVAVGSQANDFGTPGVAHHCRMIDSRRQAGAFNDELRTHMLQSLASGRDLSVAIVGGGATGVELAAELVRLAHAAESYGAEGLARQLSVTLVESGPRLLAAFPPSVSRAVEARLAALGVHVLTGRRVMAADETGYSLDNGDRIEAALKVWAAGVKAQDLLAGLDGLDCTRGNQLLVTPSLQSISDPAVFAVGDCARLPSADGEPLLPTTAQVAHQQAQFVIRHLPAWMLDGTPLPVFRYRNLGALVSIGGYDAYGSLGQFGVFRAGLTFRGLAAQAGHALLYRSHQARLRGVRRAVLLWLVDRINRRLRSRIRLV